MAVLLSLLLVAPSTSATSLIGPADFGQIVDDAELIIVGFSIDNGTPLRVNEHNIVTDWKVFPQFVLRGSWPYEPLVVRTDGGTVDGMAIAGTSLRRPGTPYIFFLIRTDEVCADVDGGAPEGSSLDSPSCTVWRPTFEFFGIQSVRSLNVSSVSSAVAIGIADSNIASSLQASLQGDRFIIEYVPFTP